MNELESVENSNRIKVISRRFRLLCTVLLFLVPVVSIIFWVFFNKLYPQLGSMLHLPAEPARDLSGMTRFMAFLVDFLQIGVIIYGIIQLRRLFGLYEKGVIFSKDNVACFSSLGRTLMVWIVANIVSQSLLSVVLTFSNPPGQRCLTVGISSRELTVLFVGIAVLCISRVMDEGRKIKEEQELFI